MARTPIPTPPLNRAPTPADLDERARTYGTLRRLDPVLQIRSAMREKGLRNADLAARMGVSEANVSRLLQGSQNLRLDTLYRLADAVGEPLTVLVGPMAQMIPTLSSPSTSRSGIPMPPVVPSPVARSHHAARTAPRLVPGDDQHENESLTSPEGTPAIHREELRRRWVTAREQGQMPDQVMPDDHNAWYVPMVDLKHQDALDSWLATSPNLPAAKDGLAIFLRSVMTGWAYGAQAVWTSRRLNLFDALTKAWKGDGASPAKTLPDASRAFLERLTWEPGGAAPFSAPTRVWGVALDRLWREGRYDHWHAGWARCRPLDEKDRGFTALKNQIWEDLYEDLNAPEDERLRAIQALVDARFPLSAKVVTMAYADQDPALLLLLAHPAPGLDARRLGLMLCQAGLANRHLNLPLAVREIFESALLAWGAPTYIDLSEKDLTELGPEKFLSAGYVCADGPRGHRNQRWQASHLPPVHGSAASIRDAAKEGLPNRVYMGTHWRASSMDWNKDHLSTYINEFEQRSLRSAIEPGPFEDEVPSLEKRSRPRL